MLVAVLAILLFVVLRPGNEDRDRPSSGGRSPVATTTPTPDPLAGLPSLAESDAFVRDLAKGLSSHPQLGAWLAARDLLRTLAVVVQNVAEGRSPARFLPFLTPATPFQAVERAGALVAEPKSFAAYDDFASAVASLDTDGVRAGLRHPRPARGCGLRRAGLPRGRLPEGRGPRDRRSRQDPGARRATSSCAAGRCSWSSPIPALESLPLAQKHLLRMGPQNARKVQAKAAELARALGL